MSHFELTLAEAADAMANRELSPVELAASVLERIEAVEGRLGAYVAVAGEAAQESAARAEREIAASTGIGACCTASRSG